MKTIKIGNTCLSSQDKSSSATSFEIRGGYTPLVKEVEPPIATFDRLNVVHKSKSSIPIPREKTSFPRPGPMMTIVYIFREPLKAVEQGKRVHSSTMNTHNFEPIYILMALGTGWV